MLGGGAGHILDMINRIKANQALRNKKSYFKTIKEHVDVKSGQKLSFPKASKDELETLKQKLKLNKCKENLKSIIALLLSILFTASLVWLVKKAVKTLL